MGLTKWKCRKMHNRIKTWGFHWLIKGKVVIENIMHESMVCPWMGGGGGAGGGVGQPKGIRFRKAHVGGDFDIHNGPQSAKF